jgi:adenylosuccinate lyase
MATEDLILNAVSAGGDRQQIHEVIRRHSIAAARAVKDEGARNDMLERLSADPEYPVNLDLLRSAITPSRFVGRSAEQVDEFLAEEVEPALAGLSTDETAAGAVRV